MTFKKGFQRYACDGDSITCEADGYTITARLYRDDCCDKPDQRDCGFWPSLDPTDAGYIGPKSQATLRRHKAKAQAIMEAWKRDEWWYVGVVLTVERSGICLVPELNCALWGIECNYPASDNSYLLSVANELLGEALEQAKGARERLCVCEEA